MSPPDPPHGSPSGEFDEYVSVTAEGQTFGLPIARVHDVFVLGAVTPVPLASQDVIGLVNLRGRVVTAIDLARRLGLAETAAGTGRAMAVGIERGQEMYGFAVDEVGDVIRLGPETRAELPAHLAARWAGLARCIHRLDGGLLVALDVDALLLASPPALAA